MSRFIDFWEGYDIPFNDGLNEHVGEDDFVVKGKYNFLDKKFKFSGKVKFSNDKGALVSSGDYSLDHKVSKNSSYKFFHKSKGETSIDGSFFLAEKNNFTFQLYKNAVINQSAKGGNGDFKTHIRAINPNFIVSAGIEKFNPLPYLCPKKDVHGGLPNLSFWALAGNKINCAAFFGGFNFAYNLTNKNIDDVKLLAAFNCEKNKIKTVAEVKVISGGEVKPSAKVHVDLGVNANNRAIAILDYSKDKVSWNLSNEYAVDGATKLKTKINDKHVLSGALVHKFSNLANFTLTTHINRIAKDESAGTTCHFKYRFGATLELFDV